MTRRRFAQVDVFTAVPYQGNPVAVVLDGDGLTDEQMAAFARWTNLSETTFVTTLADASADYSLRIFTPGGELPFAGHPTLGSCHAWLASGGTPKHPDRIVQECGIGLVELRRGSVEVEGTGDGTVAGTGDRTGDGTADARLAFRAPPLLRSGPVDEPTLELATRSLEIDRTHVVEHAWVDNGPGWLGILLDSADSVTALEPDFRRMGDLRIGVAGLHAEGEETDLEVRAFVPGVGVDEDPVTGSLNAGLAVWLIGRGVLPSSYRARQGGSVGRDGRISVRSDDDGIWIGGDSVTCIEGTVEL